MEFLENFFSKVNKTCDELSTPRKRNKSLIDRKTRNSRFSSSLHQFPISPQ